MSQERDEKKGMTKGINALKREGGIDLRQGEKMCLGDNGKEMKMVGWGPGRGRGEGSSCLTA